MKKFFIIFLILNLSLGFAFEIGNDLDESEYPDTIRIEEEIDSEKVISGSVEKNIDMNLRNCIQIALGNNPEINAAFQNILVNDAKLKQVWSNYFPHFSWQTSYSHIK